MSANGNVSRRGFLKTASAVAGFYAVPRYVLGGTGYVAPSEKVNVGVIGTGGQGTHNIRALLGESEAMVTAVCDVSEWADYSQFYYRGVAGRGPAKKLLEERYKDVAGYKCADYVDFRVMLEKEKGIDAVLIATPDHIHAPAALAAIGHGKHVYCEKPLAHSVAEVRKITEAARKAKVATQMGNQGHSGEGIRLTVEWIQDGAIGDVREVHAWSSTQPDWDDYRMSRPSETPALPNGLNWDLWLGPVAKRPYHSAYHPYKWRNWWDFGTGSIGDMACHNMDPAFWALELGHPVTVEARTSNINDETTPLASIVYYSFPARGNKPPVKMTWYDGGLMPARPDDLELGRDLDGRGNGILFVGDKGKIMCAGWAGSPQFIPASKMREYKRPDPSIRRPKGHHRDWIEACKGGPEASSNFNYSGPMTEVVLLGNVALRTGEKLVWDGKAMKATNCPKADQYITPAYQNGWTL